MDETLAKLQSAIAEFKAELDEELSSSDEEETPSFYTTPRTPTPRRDLSEVFGSSPLTPLSAFDSPIPAGPSTPTPGPSRDIPERQTRSTRVSREPRQQEGLRTRPSGSNVTRDPAAPISAPIPTPTLAHIPPSNPTPTTQSAVTAVNQPVPQNPTVSTATMSANQQKLPYKRSREAPVLEADPTREDVAVYFSDLERIFKNIGMTDVKEMKDAAVYYVSPSVAKRWRMLATFADAAKTFEHFRDEVLGFYVGSDDAHAWTRRALHELVDRTEKEGIADITDYMKFFGEFYPAYRFLSTQTPPLISEPDAVDKLWRVVPEFAVGMVTMHLRALEPKKHKDDEFSLTQVHDAIVYCLESTSGLSALNRVTGLGRINRDVARAATLAPGVPAAVTVKTEPSFATMKQEVVSEVVDRVRELLREQGPPRAQYQAEPRYGQGQYAPRYDAPANQQRGPPAGYGGGAPTGPPPCYYCGEPGCHTRSCPRFEEDRQAGLVRRNHFGAIILSTGADVPRDLPGRWIRDRVKAWHERNPGQQARGALDHMMLTVQSNLVEELPPPSEDDDIEVMEYQILMMQDRVAAKKRSRMMFDGVEVPPRPRRTTRATVDDAETSARGRGAERDLPPHLPEPPRATADKTTQTRAPAGAGKSVSPVRQERGDDAVPEHPYARKQVDKPSEPVVRDYGYAPEKRTATANENPARETRAKPSEPAPSRAEPAYRNVAPVVDPSAEKRVFERSFNEAQTVQMTPIELLSVSPGIRKLMSEATSARRVAARTTVETAAKDAEPDRAPRASTGGETAPRDKGKGRALQAMVQEVEDDEAGLPLPDNPFELYQYTRAALEEIDETDEESQDDGVDDGRGRLPKGVYRVSPGSLPSHSGRPFPTIVAEPAVRLRAIYAWVNATDTLTECVLDPGSQIVAISEEKCHELKIAYDPSASMRMICANGTVDPTLGLAENVPVELEGGLVVYLQMHVIRNASYDVLLGRPFDDVLSTTVTNPPDRKQTITVRCPNTGQQLTIPTYVRGERPKSSKPPTGFQTSMI